jgi:hypothetical protein
MQGGSLELELGLPLVVPLGLAMGMKLGGTGPSMGMTLRESLGLELMNELGELPGKQWSFH